MKRKILIICILSIFLIIGLTTLSAVGKEGNITKNTSKLHYLRETSTVSGSVYGRDSPDNPVVVPLSDATVELCGTSHYSASTDANGEFIITDVNYGFYYIKVSKDGYNDYEDTITIDNPAVNLDPITLAGKKIVAVSNLPQLICEFSLYFHCTY